MSFRRARFGLRSLTARLTLAYLFVSLTSVALVALLAHQATVREFDQLVLAQARVTFAQDALTFYRGNGSWNGVREYFRDIATSANQVSSGSVAQGAGGAAGGAGAPRGPVPQGGPATPVATSSPPGATRPLGRRTLPVFPIVDAGGVVVFPAAGYHVGDVVSGTDLAQGIPLDLGGRLIGTVLTTGERPALDAQELRYLDRTNRASLIAALGAAAIAILLGIVLASTLTRPVRELTAATRAVAAGALEHRVPVRSRDELGDLAAAFNRMSADLSRALEQRRRMTADIAHDLRTPLTVIAGYAESMRDGVLECTPARLDVLYDEAQHLLRLVEDLRTLTLADAGELPLHRQAVAIGPLLDRVVSAYELGARRADVTLTCKIEGDVPEIEVDEERLVQVLGNLVSNALRHTPAGGHITLSAAAGAASTRLSVVDDGEGINPDDLPFVFDRFYRANAARSDDGGESGLGLAIAKSIVEAHGGTITVDGAPGQGTTFTVSLPTAPANPVGRTQAGGQLSLD